MLQLHVVHVVTVYVMYSSCGVMKDKDKKIVGKGSVCYAELSFTPRFEYRIYCRVSLAENLDVAVQSNVAVITVDSSELCLP